MEKIKIIALIGEAGAGKDALLDQVCKDISCLNKIISCTTRPKREGEKEGVNYFYLSEEEFISSIKNNTMLEYTQFNGWYYGTSKELLVATPNIGVFNPAGIKNLLQYQNEIDLKVFYIYVNGKERLLRQLNREENPNINEIIRRYSTDQQDFKLLDFNYEIINNNFDFEQAKRELEDKILKFLYDNN